MFEKLMKQRRAIAFFAMVYIVFGAAFFYLLFMTPGLEFIQEETGDGTKVFLFNNSSHIINNIEIETDSGEKIAYVERLRPQKKKVLQLGEETGAVKLVAKAPYHAIASRTFSFVGSVETGEVKLSYEIAAPPTVFVDLNFPVNIEVCNDGQGIVDAGIEESHVAVFFKERGSTKMVQLGVGQCGEISFTLTPAKTGETTIYFNVKALSYSKMIEKEIMIEE